MHVDSDIVLQIIKKYTQYLQLPKKDWIKYVEPKRVATIHVPAEEESINAAEETPYEPPLPLCEVKSMNEQRYVAQLCAGMIEE